MLKKLLSLLLVCTFLLSGCQKEVENHYLGNLHLSYQLKGENNQKEYEFFYGYAFRKYLAQVQNTLGDDNANVLPFQLNDNINSLKDQKCTIEGYQEQSWEGYFAKQALEYYKEINALYNAAKSAQMTVTTDIEKEADAYFASIEKYCQQNNIELDDYLHSIYGIEANKELIINQYQKIALASQYSKKLFVNPTQTEVENYYSKHQDMFDTVTIRYIAFEKNDENKKIIDAFVNQKHTENEFKAFVLKHIDESLKTYYQQTDLSLRDNLRKEDLPNYLQIPLFNNSMQKNEVKMYEGDNSYDVVMFLKREKPIYHQVNISTIYLDARETDTSSITDKQWTACQEFANELYKKLKAEDHLTLDIFHQYNQKYSDYKENNGDYEGVSKRDSNAEIEKWIYDSSRQKGDMAVLKSTHGYSIVYFIGQGEKEYYANALKAYQNEQYELQIKKLKDTIDVSI